MIAANGKGPFDNLVGQQILVDGFSIFTLGNFSLRKNVDDREIKPYGLNGFLREIDLSNHTNEKIKFNFNFKDFTSFALYGSLKERLRGAVNNIITNFPAALYIFQNKPNTNTCDNIIISSNLSTSEFEILDDNIYNPYSINYKLNQNINQNIRNFIQRYNDYVVMVNNIEYPILGVDIPQNDNTNLKIKISGAPFSSSTQSYYILPKYDLRQEIYNNLGDFETYLLNQRTTPIYTATFTNIIETDFGSGRKFQEEEITWPSFDGYNPDINSFSFNSYIDNLLEIASRLDEIRSNYIVRMLISPEVIENDNDNFSFQKIAQIYGRQFDNIRNYIETLSYMTTVSYNKSKNIPDQLIKNFAQSLGFDVKSFYNQENLLGNIFTVENNNLSPTWGKNLSPIDIDNELWRRLVINSAYLAKSKGTRKVFDFILKFIGAPENLFEINEYVFVGNQKVDIDNLSVQIPQLNIDEIQQLLPIDNEGYPDVSKINLNFQANGIQDGGLSYIRNLTDFNVALGTSDRIDGFTLSYINDDRKTWVINNKIRTYYSDTRRANYSVSDERLVINTKNLNIFISAAKAIEYDIFNETVNNSGSTITNFYEFIEKTYQTGINPQNRKVSLYYPKLQKLWFDYVNLKYNQSKIPLSYKEINQYIKNIDGLWDNLIKQFTPATSILISGKKTSNTIFGKNKFAYKYGEDVSSSFNTNDGEFYKIKEGEYRSVKSKGSKLNIINAETRSLLKFRNKYINLHFANDFNYQLASSFLSDFRWFDNIYITLFKDNYLQLDFYENNFISSTGVFGGSNKREGSKKNTYLISGFNTSSKNIIPCNQDNNTECDDCIVSSTISGQKKKIRQECLIIPKFNITQPLNQPILPRYKEIDNFIVNLSSLFNGKINLFDFTISTTSTTIIGSVNNLIVNQRSLPGVRLSIQENKYLILTLDYSILPLDKINSITCSISTKFNCDDEISDGRYNFSIKFTTPIITTQSNEFSSILLENSTNEIFVGNNNEILEITSQAV